ncbi:MAG: hypothetical protein FGM54_05515 [Chitinophagaceae bacterium]|nr:hypothetical protein [Chitinophagaceae bacterium]
MKPLLLSLLLTSTFFLSEAKHHREKNQSSETTTVSTPTSTTSIAPTAPLAKPGSGPGKARTIRTGLIMMGSGFVGTISGGVLMGSGYSNENSGVFVAGFGLFAGGLLSGISGTVVTIVGLAMPRD